MKSRGLRRSISPMASIAGWLIIVLTAPGAGADNLQHSESFLCTAMRVHECTAAEGCKSGSAWDYNIPTFVEVDLGAKQLRTTEASGENRSSPIKNLEREEGFVFLQGVENGRAYSAVIATEPGLVTFSIAADGRSVTVFGACTPAVSTK